MSHSSFLAQKDAFKVGKRNINKVPFVELFNKRLQGVVSSGSDIKRVYVSFFEAETFDFYCSTNNNRPCGGLRGGACKHLNSLLSEAVVQYGVEQVARFLKVPADLTQIKKVNDIYRYLQGSKKPEPANEVFSRFLNYLRYLELDSSAQPLPEMSWFVG